MRLVFLSFLFIVSLVCINDSFAIGSKSISLKPFGLNKYYCIKSKPNYLAIRINSKYYKVSTASSNIKYKPKSFKSKFSSLQKSCRSGKLFSQSGSSSATATPAPNTRRGAQPPSIPLKSQWESNMLSYGRINCAKIVNQNGSFDEILVDTYYDGAWIFHQIADYTGDSSWTNCALAAEKYYRDRYVIPNNGVVPGYWNFTQGFKKSFLTNGDAKSYLALKLLAQNGLFATDSTPEAEIQTASTTREVAYAILALINAQKVGMPPRARLSHLVDVALRYIDDWTVRKNSPAIKPFMVALLSQSLIEYQQLTGDARILPALKKTWDYMWNNLWIESASSFRYLDRATGEAEGTAPAPDLNLLIAPAFAWIYNQTGDSTYQVRADKIFVGGVQKAYLLGGKQFNQNYRWSFDFIKWRSERPYLGN